MVLDCETEDKRAESPGLDLSTAEYDGDKDAELSDEPAEKFADEATDEGIARFKCPTERNCLIDEVLEVSKLTCSQPVSDSTARGVRNIPCIMVTVKELSPLLPFVSRHARVAYASVTY